MQNGGIGLVRVLVGVLAGMFLAAGLPAQTGHERGISSFYSVLRTTELGAGAGSRVQLHMRLQLANAGEDAPSARILGFESDGPLLRGLPADSDPIELPSRQTETLFRDINVSRKAYERWLADSRHRLAIEVQSSDGTRKTIELALRRISGGSEE